MTVKELIEKLETMDQNANLVIDYDDNGFYNLIGVDASIGESMVNLVSSNEM